MKAPLPKQLGITAVSLLGLLLAACGQTTPPGTPVVDYQSAPRDVIKIETHTSKLVVLADARSGVLSAAERVKLDNWVTQFGGDRPESIHAELHGAAGGLIAVRDALVHEGVEKTKLLLVTDARVASTQPGTVAVAIDAKRAVAVLPPCPGWITHTTAPSDNANEPNFGCSDTSNLAAMVADPADLARGQSNMDADGQVTSTAVENYRNDKVKVLPTTSTTTTLGGGSSGGGGQ